MSRATDALLDELHALTASSQAEELKRNLERTRLPMSIPDPDDPTGKRTIANPAYEPLNTKLLALVIKFLKDNGIDAPVSAARFSGLEQQLKDLDLDEVSYGVQ